MEPITSNASLEEISSSFMSLFERKIKFYSLLALQVPCILCMVFIFYHFKWRYMQTQIYGFVLIVNGLIVTVELPITLYFLHEGTIHSTSRCTGWIALNYSLFQLSIYLMTWTSIERYLFIYHERLIMGHIILLHYVPIIVLTLYCPSLYLGIVVLYTCQPAYDVQYYICGGPCYSLERVAGLLDWIGNGVTMEFAILLINIILIIRHSIQRYRMKRVVITADRRQQWRRSAKLAMQLLAIAMLYILAWIPYSTIVLTQLFQSSEQLTYILSTYFAYVPYLQSLLLPYVCILFIPAIKQKVFPFFATLYCCKTRFQHNRVATIERGQRSRTLPQP